MKALSEQAIAWVRAQFEADGRKTAVIGISGGKDSAVAAAICVKALGAENVYGVLMPQGIQPDLDDSVQVVRELGIRHQVVNIGEACRVLRQAIDIRDTAFDTPDDPDDLIGRVTEDAWVNLQPRIRMTTLRAIAQTLSGPAGGKACVVGTGNKAEIMVGYTTKDGDDRSDLNPLGGLWVDEVLQVGDELGYYPGIVHKAPSDGLCGKSDEDRLGFTYDQVKLAFTGRAGEVPAEQLERIMRWHRMTEHKRRAIPVFEPER